MTTNHTSWTNDDILDTFLRVILTDIYQAAQDEIESVRDAANANNPNRLRDRLVELQLGVFIKMCALVDGSTGPTNWPGIRLANDETGETLTENLCWEVSRTESIIIDIFDL